MIQDPFDLRPGKIGVDQQAGLLPEELRKALVFQRIAELGRPPALPHDCMIDGLTCILIPYDHRLSLIRDADRGNILRIYADLIHRLNRYPQLGGPYLVRIMLHPSWFWEILGKFLLCHAAYLSLFIE